MYKKTLQRLLTILAVGTSASLHAATNILPGPDQDRPGSVNQQAPNPLSVEGLSGEQRSIFQRETLIGDPDGLRTLAAELGIASTPVYIGEVQGNPTGGIEHGVTYDGLLNVPLDLDLDRITHFTSDLVLHTNALWLHGQGLSTRKVGDFSNVSNIAGYNTVRLQELWLQQSFWLKRVSIRLGILAADAEFFTSTTSSLFINGTFGAFTFVGANLPDPPVYPVAVPGVRFAIAPVSFLSFQAGIYGGDSGGSQDQNNHGTNFNLRSGDGALIFAEAAYTLNQSPGDRGLQGTYKLGSFVHTGSRNFNTFDSQARNVLGVGSIKNRGTNFGVYGIGDQELYKAGGKTVTAFVRVGGAPSDANFVDFYADGGFNFTGFVPGRFRDVAGVALAYSNVSGEYSDSQRAQGAPGFSNETVLEATYRVNVAPWWSVQPDLQYVFNPSGQNGSHDALVLGVRTSVAF